MTIPIIIDQFGDHFRQVTRERYCLSFPELVDGRVPHRPRQKRLRFLFIPYRVASPEFYEGVLQGILGRFRVREHALRPGL